MTRIGKEETERKEMRTRNNSAILLLRFFLFHPSPIDWTFLVIHAGAECMAHATLGMKRQAKHAAKTMCTIQKSENIQFIYMNLLGIILIQTIVPRGRGNSSK